MASPLIFYGQNLLEVATLLVVLNDDPDHPYENLHDRDIEVRWRLAAVSSGVIVDLDQGASPSQIVSALILDGHLFGGGAVTIQSGDAYPFSWVTRVNAQSIPSNARFRVTFAPVLARYWRITLQGSPIAQQATELWLTDGFTVSAAPQVDTASFGSQPVGIRFVSDAGHYWGNVRNDNLWRATYTLPFLSEAERDNFITFYQSIFGVYPFYLVDHAGVTRFVTFTEQDLVFEDQHAGGATTWNVQVSVVEVR
jgi:hypothetical protein